MTLTLKIKPINEYAKIPHYANEGVLEWTYILLKKKQFILVKRFN